MTAFMILIPAVFTGLLIYGVRFPSIGTAEGVIRQAEVETHNDTETYRHDRTHADPRMYRYHVSYHYEGVEYYAKSWRAYQVPKYFPGDRVSVRISSKSMAEVDIIGPLPDR